MGRRRSWWVGEEELKGREKLQGREKMRVGGGKVGG